MMSNIIFISFIISAICFIITFILTTLLYAGGEDLGTVVIFSTLAFCAGMLWFISFPAILSFAIVYHSLKFMHKIIIKVEIKNTIPTI